MTTPVLRMSCAMYVLLPPGAADMSSTRSPWKSKRVGGGGDRRAKRGTRYGSEQPDGRQLLGHRVHPTGKGKGKLLPNRAAY